MVSSHFLLALLGAVYCASALHLGMRGEIRPSLISKRAHISGLQNGQNLVYTVNITLGGLPFEVQADTGSSDLWVLGPIPGANDTGANTSITYAIGEVAGEIKTTQLEFAGFTVPNQAFMEVTALSNIPPGQQGILGLGPNIGSNIFVSLGNQSVGDAVLDRIFKQDVSTPNFLTVLLGRANDPAENFPGNLTVGEIIPGLENITSQPKLPVTALTPDVNTDQHWQVLLDENGIIGPDGKPISVQTKVLTTKNPNQLTVMFDTGFSLPQVPLEVANAIYSGVPGATLQNVTGIGPIWVIPCSIPIDIAFKFGGITYPVHPLDTNSDSFTTPDGKSCIGAFQPIASPDPNLDMILGDSFLRNVYTLINFGNFIDGSTSAIAPPFVQLLSITDPTTANDDFTKERLNPPPSSGAMALHDEFHSSKPPGGSSSSGGTSNSNGFMKEKIPIIIVSSVGVGLVLLGTLAVCCTRNRFSKSGQGSLANTYRSYQRLEVPAPRGDYSQVHGYYHSATVPMHESPWGRR